MNGRLALVLLLAPGVLAAQAPEAAPDTARAVRFGAFADVYYAWDFNRPGAANFDRAFATQPARQDEFNVNLAFVEAKLTGERVRGRLALQAGTAVQSNYAGEPRTGSVSGPELARNIQEAVVGVRAAKALWVDAGLYLSHIGQESWISRDNPTYTRSLIAEYSPYYETGVKATWAATAKLTVQLHLLNGWQNIAETNRAKALGLRLDYAVSPELTVGYANFIGNEAPDSTPSRTRVFNEVYLALSAGRFGAWLTFDHGLQGRGPALGTSTWHGGAAIARYRLGPTLALAVRLERYADPDGVIVVTGTAGSFVATAASVGVDVGVPGGAVWRTELRGYRGRDPVFPRRGGAGFSRDDAFAVSSLALTF